MRLSFDRTVFAIQKKGEKAPQVKTASEISQDHDMLKQIDQQDAHMIGYTAASESMLEEKKQKEKLRKKLEVKTQQINENKIVFVTIWPIAFLVRILKITQKLDAYDIGVNYNPFKLSK